MPSYGSRPFQESIDYFKKKMPLPTNGWEDVYAEQHDTAFMVSGANKTAIVEDFATAIQGAIENGETLQDFRNRFDDIVKTHGWDYNGTRGWRSKLIYTTNVRQAYNAGREAQFADPEYQKVFPYMEYRHSGAEHPRLLHKSWDRMVLRADDPWWNAHSPSNGYGCNCKKFPKSERGMRKLGKATPDKAPPVKYYDYTDKRTGEVKAIPEGVMPGFEYRPNQAAREHFTPRQSDVKRHPIPMGRPDQLPLPKPTPVSAKQVLADGLDDTAYLDAFLNEFGITNGESVVFRDVMDEPVMISDALFRNSKGELKIQKDKIRHRYITLLAQALIDPDEIWSLLEPDNQNPDKYRLARRYLKRWTIIESGETVHGFSVFEYGKGVWNGRTVFTPHKKRGGQQVPENDNYMEKQREGVRLYRKQE
ncbi:MAG: PBECR2 nuclease fold domain-containing protein [Marinomonas foliarum]|uniref:PBECR2 nuclease fold domain-containing protein n=1 Tax=Marinomonas foliarum TaxID=491950 RepID=UPI003F99F809